MESVVQYNELADNLVYQLDISINEAVFNDQ
jgi:hypothetical protein